MSERCGHKLAGGGACLHPVNDDTVACAAGHAQNGNGNRSANWLADTLLACRMRRAADGWVCDAHDLAGENWRVALSLGAMPPCRVPTSTEDTIKEILSNGENLSLAAGLILAHDEDNAVRSALAMVSSNSEVLSVLSDQRIFSVDLSLSGNPALPEEALRQIVRYYSSNVAWAPVVAHVARVCKNVQILEDLYEQVPSDETLLVALSLNESCPEWVMLHLSQSESTAVRAGLAQNPNCPADIRESLSGHFA